MIGKTEMNRKVEIKAVTQIDRITGKENQSGIPIITIKKIKIIQLQIGIKTT